MELSPNLIPVRWPSGPLAIRLGREAEGFTPQAQATLSRWHDPAALAILKDTPVNCLMVNWAAGIAEDAEQQKSAAPLVAEALRRNLAVIGWVEAAADPNLAIAAAKAAGLTALAIRGFKGTSGFPVIPYADRAAAPWDSTAPVIAITGNVWPGVRLGQGDDSEAGPTGLPWVDSNGWYIQLARARTRSDVWVMFDPPGGRNVVPARTYATAVADAEAAGGRWVISLATDLRARLADGDATARETWKGLTTVASFFATRRQWRSFQPLGIIGVVSDFTGANFDVGGELLNLLARFSTPLRVIWKQTATGAFTGLKALVYVDGEPPSKELRQRLLAFVPQGGLLVTGPGWGPEGQSTGPDTHLRFDVRSLGKGRLAVGKADISDPYQLAIDTQILLSHSNDLIRFYGTGASVCCHYTGSPDNKRALLQLLTYPAGPGREGPQMTVWMHRKFQRARLSGMAGGEPLTLESAVAEGGGAEYYLPQVPAYGAIELEI